MRLLSEKSYNQDFGYRHYESVGYSAKLGEEIFAANAGHTLFLTTLRACLQMRTPYGFGGNTM